jgi:phospholipase A1
MPEKIQFNVVFLMICLVALSARASELSSCASIGDVGERLTCYDKLAQSESEASIPAVNSLDSPSSSIVDTSEKIQRSYLDRAWNLDGLNHSNSEHDIGRLNPHRASYFIARESTRTNPNPSTPSPGHAALTPLSINDYESKFQISFKSEVWDADRVQWMGFENIHLWAAYTQQSNWQLFTPNNSSPFRENNYEPELIATLGTGNLSGLKLINLGLVHQSNGQALPLSRSWNRLYVQGGWEWGNLSLLGRGWWRIPESTQQDDNPDITKYLGHGDVVLHWEPNKIESFNLLLRNNLNINQNYGLMQLDWATPIPLGNFAKMHVQLTSGFGESLIDYNHRQTTIGLGFSFRDW